MFKTNGPITKATLVPWWYLSKETETKHQIISFTSNQTFTLLAVMFFDYKDLNLKKYFFKMQVVETCISKCLICKT